MTEEPYHRGTCEQQGGVLSPMGHGRGCPHGRLPVPESYIEVSDQDEGRHDDPENHIGGLEHGPLLLENRHARHNQDDVPDSHPEESCEDAEKPALSVHDLVTLCRHVSPPNKSKE